MFAFPMFFRSVLCCLGFPAEINNSVTIITVSNLAVSFTRWSHCELQLQNRVRKLEGNEKAVVFYESYLSKDRFSHCSDIAAID